MSEWNMGFDPEYAGWLPPEDRTVETQKQAEQMVFDTPLVSEVFTGSHGGESKRPRVWEYVKQAIDKKWIPKEYVRNGQLKNISQIIGSCVGFGAGNMLLYASLIDAIVRRQKERILVPFVPYHYGRGRLHAGIRGPGSGSTGSGQAKALQEDGYLAFDSKGVDKVNFGDSIQWTKNIEYTWSDGARIDGKFVTAGQDHLCTTVARVSNTEEAAMLADSHYSFTIASNWGGRMRCPVKDGVLLNDRVTQWMHQMSVVDYIDHPRLGRLWWILNQWRYPHGKDPGGEWDNHTGAPEGGFYVTDRDLAYILRQRDSWAFADPQGFVDRTREFEWIMG